LNFFLRQPTRWIHLQLLKNFLLGFRKPHP
jgi:hypothetical protein